MSKAGTLTRSRSKRANRAKSAPGTPGQLDSLNSPPLDIKTSPYTDLGRTLYSDDQVIGLALGSPGQSLLPLLLSDDQGVNVSHEAPVSPDSPEVIPDGSATVTDVGTGRQGFKRTGSKWKSLGGIFGRKESIPGAARTPQFYELEDTTERGLVEHKIAQDPLEINMSQRRRAYSCRSKVGIDSSQNAANGESSSVLRRNSSRTKGLRKRKVEEMKPAMLRLHNALSAHEEAEERQASSATSRQPPASLLQVEIPNIKMDRYSVMFGDLLHPGCGPQIKQHSSALTWKQDQRNEVPTGAGPSPWDARQHSADAFSKSRHSRDNSNSSRTLSFSLFPTSTSTICQPANDEVMDKPIPKSSPLARSMTAPKSIAPLSRPRIHKSNSEGRDQVLLIVQNSAPLPSTPTPSIRRKSSDAAHLSRSSTQFSSHEWTEFPDCPRSSMDVNPSTTNVKVARPAFVNCTFPVRNSSIRKLPQSSEEPITSSHFQRDSAGTVTEVSIARQVSISRRQQQLVVPIVPKFARQPKLPILVNEAGTPATRESHHLTLESA